MNILFVTSNSLGDAVLSNAVLAWLIEQYPEASFSVACGPVAASLYERVPQVTEIQVLYKQKRSGHWVDFWKKNISQKWDLIVDLRNSIATRLLRKKEIILFKNDKQLKHKVDHFANLFQQETFPLPRLWLTQEDLTWAEGHIPKDEKVIALSPAANWIGKQWPIENYIALVKELLEADSFCQDVKFAVFATEQERSLVAPLLAFIPKEKCIDLVGKTTPLQAGACLSLCKFFIGNDSGLMHLAAAAETPTVGLFGPSYPQIYAPAGENTVVVQTPETFDDLIDYEGYSPQTCGCLMKTLKVEAVYRDAQKLWESVYGA